VAEGSWVSTRLRSASAVSRRTPPRNCGGTANQRSPPSLLTGASTWIAFAEKAGSRVGAVLVPLYAINETSGAPAKRSTRHSVSLEKGAVQSRVNWLGVRNRAEGSTRV